MILQCSHSPSATLTEADGQWKLHISEMNDQKLFNLIFYIYKVLHLSNVMNAKNGHLSVSHTAWVLKAQRKKGPNLKVGPSSTFCFV